MLRATVERLQRRLLSGLPTEPLPDLTTGSSLVVAPHQDDETLGCGGTIALKCSAGTRVTVLFLMDGSRSHIPLIDPEELSAIRHSEAVNAAAKLGVPAEDVRFLDLPEGDLASNLGRATDGIAAVIAEVHPQQVFVTAEDEPHKDHAAASRAVRAAVRESDRRLSLYEYPVWCWYHWPNVPLPLSRRTIGPGSRLRYELPRVLRNTRSMSLGLEIHRRFPVRVPIGAVLSTKRAALEEHRSQVSRIRSTPRWAVLSDVGGGMFVERFFGGDERFRLVELDSTDDSPAGTASAMKH